MRKIKKFMAFGGLLAGALLATQSVSAADVSSDAPDSFDSDRFYVSAFGGVSFITDQTFDGVVTGTPLVVNLDFDTGFTVGGAIGHEFGNNLRGEFEVVYSENDIDTLDFTGSPASPDTLIGDADFRTVNLAFNGLIDIETGTDLKPYLGGGIGIAFTDLEAAYVPGVVLGDDDENFLLQAIVGFTHSVTDDVDFFAEGRYTRIFDIEAPRVLPTGVPTGVGEDGFDTYALNWGLRFKFN